MPKKGVKRKLFTECCSYCQNVQKFLSSDQVSARFAMSEHDGEHVMNAMGENIAKRLKITILEADVGPEKYVLLMEKVEKAVEDFQIREKRPTILQNTDDICQELGKF